MYKIYHEGMKIYLSYSQYLVIICIYITIILLKFRNYRIFKV